MICEQLLDLEQNFLNRDSEYNIGYSLITSFFTSNNSSIQFF